ncbi:YceI family protein [Marilutibacter chinensis]|uniref:YceI family protein n=1 Tax=Marilutibacter chinensis TaxID=2912247 RepID=A0ABS9HNY6_9GAMM|nr:YceI family protein [Lysobacter chinensis]MCF7220696.1 YceI family protein [Lysobacter chinensis]
MNAVRRPSTLAAVLAVAVFATTLAAEPVVYEIEPDHTYPSFEADHVGISVWRGKFNRTSGEVTLDKEAGSGTLEVEVDLSSIDFGHDVLNGEMAGPEYFDTANHPTATYTGTLADFVDGVPTRVDGELSLRGVTRPVTLDIRSFKCMPHPMYKRDWCGADAYATIDRAAFGIDAGKDWGFDMKVALRIQVEAIRRE